MGDNWNNTCVLISNTGDVVLSNPMLRGHNEAISDCAKKIGLDISTEQAMPLMLQELTINNHTILLNCGRVKDDNGIEKRTGYLALPTNFSVMQLEQVEIFKLLLEDYHAITVWGLEDNKLKTKSMGNSNLAILIVQEMIDKVVDKNIEGIQK